MRLQRSMFNIQLQPSTLAPRARRPSVALPPCSVRRAPGAPRLSPLASIVSHVLRRFCYTVHERSALRVPEL